LIQISDRRELYPTSTIEMKNSAKPELGQGWFVEPDQSDLPAMAYQIRAWGCGRLTRRANHF